MAKSETVAPDVFDDIEAEATNDTETSPSVQADKPSESTGNVTLKCPHSMTSLSHPEGLFPTVTREGTEMTQEEAKHAKAAAKAARKTLITVGGRNR